MHESAITANFGTDMSGQSDIKKKVRRNSMVDQRGSPSKQLQGKNWDANALNRTKTGNNRKSRMLYNEPLTQLDMMEQLKEAVCPHEAIRMGHSGWIGYDMFCSYSDKMSERNLKIFSQRTNTETTQQNQLAVKSPMMNQAISQVNTLLNESVMTDRIDEEDDESTLEPNIY